VRIGIDMLDIGGFARIAGDPRACRTLFTDAELAFAQTLGDIRRGEYLAGRFCAKEAVAKLLGRGYGQDGLRWRDIEVGRDDHGAPTVSLSGAAGQIAESRHVRAIELSLSHHAGLVVCVAVATHIEVTTHTEGVQQP
jgi:holo-[acyl-carrier protein] synthase